MAGKLGLEVSLEDLSEGVSRNDYALFSQSQGRLVVTVNPKCRGKFEELLEGNNYKLIGKVRADSRFVVKDLDGDERINVDVDKMTVPYKSPFEGY